MDYEKVNAVGLMAIRALRALEARRAWRHNLNSPYDLCPLCGTTAEADAPIDHNLDCPARLAEEALVEANNLAMRGANLDVRA